jgi:dipeptidyl aminopeptidase/acylaminoacyl peptidase
MRNALILVLAAAPSWAQQAPSYARDIAPILNARCSGCHAEGVKMGSLNTDTYAELMKGGTHGTIVIPGNSRESRLVKMLKGEAKPLMPMDGTTLAAGEIELFERWIDAGAPAPTPEEEASLRRKTAAQKAPELKPRATPKPSVFAIAWHPQGSLLALARFRSVTLADPRTGQPAAQLGGHAEAVRALSFSRDGKLLAAAGGKPGKSGEVKIWNLESRSPAATIAGHSDCIYAAAFSPDGKTLATAGYDKLIKLWDPATGKEIRTLKDHIDAVYALEFTPDGALLISGSADRSVKVWNPTTGERLYTMSEPLDGINAIAVSPDGKRVAAGGLDKSVRVWTLGEKEATLEHSLMAHEDAILKLAWSPDGNSIVSTAADRSIKVLRAADLSETKLLPGQPDWVLGLGFSPDGKTLAAARFDGSLSLYNVSNFQDALETRRAAIR